MSVTHIWLLLLTRSMYEWSSYVLPLIFMSLQDMPMQKREIVVSKCHIDVSFIGSLVETLPIFSGDKKLSLQCAYEVFLHGHSPR